MIGGAPLTAEAQERMGRFGGWGPADGPFAPGARGNDLRDQERLRAVLTRLGGSEQAGERLFSAAAMTVLNAHYTDPMLVRVIYRALGDLGLEQGTVVDVGSGAGHFATFAPDGIRITGIELDPATALINQLLHPDAVILVGSVSGPRFARVRDQSANPVRVPRDTADGFAGNVPFSDVKWPDDVLNPGQKFPLHDHAALWGVTRVAPGGLCAFITSRYTADKLNPGFRRTLAGEMDLIGMVRLPSTAHKRMAGTPVVTDIIIGRRLADGERPRTDPETWEQARPLPLPGTSLTALVNTYYHANPQHVLGTLSADGMRRAGDFSVEPSGDLQEQLSAALGEITSRALAAGQRHEPRPAARPVIEILSRRPDGTVSAHPDGTFTQVVHGQDTLLKISNAREADQVRRLVAVAEALAALRKAEAACAEDTDETDAARARLGEAYDGYASAYGAIGRFTVRTRNHHVTTFKAVLDRLDFSKMDVPDPEVTLLEQYLGRGALTRVVQEVADPGHVRYGTRKDKRGNEVPTKTQLVQVASVRVALTAALAEIPQGADAERLAAAFGERMSRLETSEQRTRLMPVAFRSDPRRPAVEILENFDPVTQTAVKKAVFTRRTAVPHRLELGADTPEEALDLVLIHHRRVDLAEIARLLGTDEANARDKLGTLVFDDPAAGGRLVAAGEYLSGNVREKLAQARTAAAGDPERYTANVESLQAVQPAALGYQDIQARLGSAWLSRQVVQDGLRQILDDPTLTVTHPGGAAWAVSTRMKRNSNAQDRYGTSDWNAVDLAEALLTNASVVVYRKRVDPQTGEEKSYRDDHATLFAYRKAQRLDADFVSWLWSDPDRAEECVRLYNAAYNNQVKRKWNSAPFLIPGLAPGMMLHPFQSAMVRRLHAESGLAAWVVGAGKTELGIVAAMEGYRLGRHQLAAFVCPAGLVNQWRDRIYRTYPGASVLVADDDLRARKDAREIFTERAASGDYQLSVIPYEFFGSLELSADAARASADEEIAKLTRYANEAAAQGDRYTAKRLQGQIARIEAQYAAAAQGAGGATGFTDARITSVIVDEWHNFRRITRASNNRSMAIIKGSDRADHMLAVFDYLRKRHPEGMLLGLSGTPLEQSIADAWTAMRFFAPERLSELGLEEFDAFLTTFGRTEARREPTPTGSGLHVRERASDWFNLPEMRRVLWDPFADVVRSADLGLNVPRLAGGRPQVHVLPQTPGQASVQAQIDEGYARFKGGDRGPDNHILRLMDRAAKNALHPRMLGMETDGKIKLEAWADERAAWYHATKDTRFRDRDGNPHPRAGAFCFVACELGVPDPARPNAWSVYAEMRSLLTERGVPADAIRFAQDAAGSDRKKAALWEDARTGGCNIVIGSASTAGTGVDAPDRAQVLDYITLSWNPTQFEQWLGRIVRQGNQNPEVAAHVWSTEGTIEVLRADKIAMKSAPFEALLDGTSETRRVNEETYDPLSAWAADMASRMSGNPLLNQQREAQLEVDTAQGMQDEWQRENGVKARRIATMNREIQELEDENAAIGRALARAVDTRGDNFAAQVGAVRYTARAEAGAALIAALAATAVSGDVSALTDGNPQHLGELAGFPVTARYKRHEAERPAEAEDGQDPAPEPTPAELTWVSLGLEGVPDGQVDMMRGSELPGRDPVGLMTSLEGRIRRLPGVRDKNTAAIAENRDQIPKTKAELAQPSPYLQQLADARDTLDRIETEIDAQLTSEPDTAAPADTEPAPASPGEPAPDAGTEPADSTAPLADGDIASLPPWTDSSPYSAAIGTALRAALADSDVTQAAGSNDLGRFLEWLSDSGWMGAHAAASISGDEVPVFAQAVLEDPVFAADLACTIGTVVHARCAGQALPPGSAALRPIPPITEMSALRYWQEQDAAIGRAAGTDTWYDLVDAARIDIWLSRAGLPRAARLLLVDSGGHATLELTDAGGEQWRLTIPSAKDTRREATARYKVTRSGRDGWEALLNGTPGSTTPDQAAALLIGTLTERGALPPAPGQADVAHATFSVSAIQARDTGVPQVVYDDGDAAVAGPEPPPGGETADFSTSQPPALAEDTLPQPSGSGMTQEELDFAYRHAYEFALGVLRDPDQAREERALDYAAWYMAEFGGAESLAALPGHDHAWGWFIDQGYPARKPTALVDNEELIADVTAAAAGRVLRHAAADHGAVEGPGQPQSSGPLVPRQDRDDVAASTSQAGTPVSAVARELIPQVTVLHGHTSPETAYLVDDYPYGRRLRCKARYWLETAVKGASCGQVRMVRQTTNPKEPGEPWNKPHPGGYHSWAVLYLADNGHVELLTCGHWGPSPALNARIRLDGIYDQLDDVERSAYDKHLARSLNANARGWEDWHAQLASVRSHLADHGTLPDPGQLAQARGGLSWYEAEAVAAVAAVAAGLGDIHAALPAASQPGTRAPSSEPVVPVATKARPGAGPGQAADKTVHSRDPSSPGGAEGPETAGIPETRDPNGDASTTPPASEPAAAEVPLAAPVTVAGTKENVGAPAAAHPQPDTGHLNAEHRLPEPATTQETAPPVSGQAAADIPRAAAQAPADIGQAPGPDEPAGTGPYSRRVRIALESGWPVVSGTDFNDPAELRKVLRDNFTWNKKRQVWDHNQRKAAGPEEAAQAVRDVLARLDRESVPTPTAKEFPPTPQQQAILNAFLAGQTIAVQALAGTGKTTTLVLLARALMARSPEARIIYTAFNASIVKDAKRGRFDRNVTASTMHSLARQSLLQTGYAGKIEHADKGARWPEQWTEVLGIPGDTTAETREGAAPSDAVEVARLVIATVRKFRESADGEPGRQHLPYLAGPAGSSLSETVLSYARQAWADISGTGNAKALAAGRALRVEHDDYLKVWALSRPRIDAEVIFFDEAQDVNDVMRAVVLDQSAQTVVVGDSHQSIYGFRGAIDALKDWPADIVLPLTQSWRFGSAAAAFGNLFLRSLGSKLLLEGNPARATRLGSAVEPDAILCRTNATAVAEVFAGLESGKRTALVGGGDAIKEIAKAARDLQAGRGTKHPDLSRFADWGEVRDYARNEEDGKSLQVFVRLVDQHGPGGLIAMIDQLTPEGDTSNPPQLTISTAHKAKGLEWDVVRVAGDFRGPAADPETGEVTWPVPEERRLAYVAATRARKLLEPGSLTWIYDYPLPGTRAAQGLASDQARTAQADTLGQPEHAGREQEPTRQAARTTPEDSTTDDAPGQQPAPAPATTQAPAGRKDAAPAVPSRDSTGGRRGKAHPGAQPPAAEPDPDEDRTAPEAEPNGDRSPAAGEAVGTRAPSADDGAGAGEQQAAAAAARSETGTAPDASPEADAAARLRALAEQHGLAVTVEQVSPTITLVTVTDGDRIVLRHDGISGTRADGIPTGLDEADAYLGAWRAYPGLPTRALLDWVRRSPDDPARLSLSAVRAVAAECGLVAEPVRAAGQPFIVVGHPGLSGTVLACRPGAPAASTGPVTIPVPAIRAYLRLYQAAVEPRWLSTLGKRGEWASQLTAMMPYLVNGTSLYSAEARRHVAAAAHAAGAGDDRAVKDLMRRAWAAAGPFAPTPDREAVLLRIIGDAAPRYQEITGDGPRYAAEIAHAAGPEWDWIYQYVRDHPDVLTGAAPTHDAVEQRKAGERAQTEAEANALSTAAKAAFDAGDYPAALDLADQGELADPGRSRHWEEIRDAIREKATAAGHALEAAIPERPAPALPAADVALPQQEAAAAAEPGAAGPSASAETGPGADDTTQPVELSPLAVPADRDEGVRYLQQLAARYGLRVSHVTDTLKWWTVHLSALDGGPGVPVAEYKGHTGEWRGFGAGQLDPGEVDAYLAACGEGDLHDAPAGPDDPYTRIGQARFDYHRTLLAYQALRETKAGRSLMETQDTEKPRPDAIALNAACQAVNGGWKKAFAGEAEAVITRFAAWEHAASTMAGNFAATRHRAGIFRAALDVFTESARHLASRTRATAQDPGTWERVFEGLPRSAQAAGPAAGETRAPGAAQSVADPATAPTAPAPADEASPQPGRDEPAGDSLAAASARETAGHRSYRLTRQLPDGTVRESPTAFTSLRSAAQAVAYTLADNGAASRKDAAALASRLQDAALGTTMTHPSGYSFRIRLEGALAPLRNMDLGAELDRAPAEVFARWLSLGATPPAAGDLDYQRPGAGSHATASADGIEITVNEPDVTRHGLVTWSQAASWIDKGVTPARLGITVTATRLSAYVGQHADQLAAAGTCDPGAVAAELAQIRATAIAAIVEAARRSRGTAVPVSPALPGVPSWHTAVPATRPGSGPGRAENKALERLLALRSAVREPQPLTPQEVRDAIRREVSLAEVARAMGDPAAMRAWINDQARRAPSGDYDGSGRTWRGYGPDGLTVDRLGDGRAPHVIPWDHVLAWVGPGLADGLHEELLAADAAHSALMHRESGAVINPGTVAESSAGEKERIGRRLRAADDAAWAAIQAAPPPSPADFDRALYAARETSPVQDSLFSLGDVPDSADTASAVPEIPPTQQPGSPAPSSVEPGESAPGTGAHAGTAPLEPADRELPPGTVNGATAPDLHAPGQGHQDTSADRPEVSGTPADPRREAQARDSEAESPAEPVNSSDLVIAMRHVQGGFLRVLTEGKTPDGGGTRSWREDGEPDARASQDIDHGLWGVEITLRGRGFRRHGRLSWAQIASWIDAGVTPARLGIILTADRLRFACAARGGLAAAGTRDLGAVLAELDRIVEDGVNAVVNAALHAHGGAAPVPPTRHGGPAFYTTAIVTGPDELASDAENAVLDRLNQLRPLVHDPQPLTPQEVRATIRRWIGDGLPAYVKALGDPAGMRAWVAAQVRGPARRSAGITYSTPARPGGRWYGGQPEGLQTATDAELRARMWTLIPWEVIPAWVQPGLTGSLRSRLLAGVPGREEDEPGSRREALSAAWAAIEAAPPPSPAELDHARRVYGGASPAQQTLFGDLQPDGRDTLRPAPASPARQDETTGTAAASVQGQSGSPGQAAGGPGTSTNRAGQAPQGTDTDDTQAPPEPLPGGHGNSRAGDGGTAAPQDEPPAREPEAAPGLPLSADSPAKGREASPNPAAAQDAKAPDETATASTAETAQEEDIPAHPAVTADDRTKATAADAAGDPGSHPDTAPIGIPAPRPHAEPRQVELPGATRATTPTFPAWPFVAGGPGTGPEVTPAPAPAPRADDLAPLTSDDIVLGVSRLPAFVLGELFHAADNGQPLGRAGYLLRSYSGKRAADEPGAGARETVTAVPAGLRIEVAAPGARRAGLVTWQQVDGLLRPGATPARRQIVTRAWQVAISFTGADSSFRAVGEGLLAAAARDELTAIAVTVVRAILEAVRPAGRTGFSQLADEAAMTRRIAELAATLPAGQPRPRTPAAEVTPGDVIGHYSYRFHPFLVTEPPRQAGDSVEITGRLTEPEPDEPARPFTLTVPPAGRQGAVVTAIPFPARSLRPLFPSHQVTAGADQPAALSGPWENTQAPSAPAPAPVGEPQPPQPRNQEETMPLAAPSTTPPGSEEPEAAPQAPPAPAAAPPRPATGPIRYANPTGSRSQTEAPGGVADSASLTEELERLLAALQERRGRADSADFSDIRDAFAAVRDALSLPAVSQEPGPGQPAPALPAAEGFTDIRETFADLRDILGLPASSRHARGDSPPADTDAAVARALDQATAEAQACARWYRDTPEWQRAITISRAARNLVTAIRNAAGDYWAEIRADVRVRGFARTLAARTALAVAGPAHLLATGLERAGLQGSRPWRAAWGLHRAATTFATWVMRYDPPGSSDQIREARRIISGLVQRQDSPAQPGSGRHAAPGGANGTRAPNAAGLADASFPVTVSRGNIRQAAAPSAARTSVPASRPHAPHRQ